jgi:hypothetical protein
MKQRRTSKDVEPIADDDLRRHFQISLRQIRAGEGITAEESLRQLEEDLEQAPKLDRRYDDE